MSAPRRPRRVLFLSTRNAARWLMAEAWLRQVGGDDFEVGSAGTQPADEFDPMAVQVMQEVGVDLSASRRVPAPTCGVKTSTWSLSCARAEVSQRLISREVLTSPSGPLTTRPAKNFPMTTAACADTDAYVTNSVRV